MNRAVRQIALALVAAAGIGSVGAEEAPARAAQIYQQRTADGRTVLSDRPVAGAQLQRLWSITAEDPVAAQARSDKMRQEAQAVSERIQRQLDSDRERAATLDAARRRVALAEAEREAERARQAARETAIYLPPGWGQRGPRVRPFRPWPRPAPVRPSPDRRWPSVGG